MSKKKLVIIIVGFVALFGLAFLSYNLLSENFELNSNLVNNSSSESSSVPAENSENTSSESEISVSETEVIMAPDFTVYTANGEAVKLSDFAGKPVIINFWATWCGYCKMEMPDFNKLAEEYGDKIVFMMINVTDGSRETVEKGEAYIAENGFTFPVYYDTNLEATNIYGAYSLPATGFIAPDGEFLGGQMGMMDEETLRSVIEQIFYIE